MGRIYGEESSESEQLNMYKKREKIKIVISEIKTNMKKLRYAVKAAGVSRSTWYLWEQANPRLEKLRIRAQKLCEEERTEAMEDANFKAGLNGNVAAQCFYLKNKAGWKDTPFIDQSQHITQIVNYGEKSHTNHTSTKSRV